MNDDFVRSHQHAHGQTFYDCIIENVRGRRERIKGVHLRPHEDDGAHIYSFERRRK